MKDVSLRKLFCIQQNYWIMQRCGKYGIAVPDGISFNLEKIIDRKDKVVKKLTGGVKQTVKSYGAELIEKKRL